jgi:ZIP family zinc transporter
MTETEIYLFCLLLPATAALCGGLSVRLWRPSTSTLAAVGHFTAGLVLGAVAIELCPTLVEGDSFIAVVLGFSLGALFMLAIGHITRHAESSSDSSDSSAGLLFAVAVDLFVDGLLLGTALIVGLKQGMLIAIALTIEAFFLCLATSESLRARKATPGKIFAAAFMLATLLAVGVVSGHFFSAQLTGATQAATLAFATAALLYLVVEELLVEAHREKDRRLTPGLFFAGFLLIFIMQRVLGG